MRKYQILASLRQKIIEIFCTFQLFNIYLINFINNNSNMLKDFVKPPLLDTKKQHFEGAEDTLRALG